MGLGAIVAALAFGACLQDKLPQQVDAAVDQLGSENIEAREAAFERLVALGLPAVAELRRHSLHPDGEVRARARQAIEEIGRRDRILALRPGPRRLSLELTEAPVAEVLEAAFKPFGIVAKTRPDLKYPQALLSLTLKDATLWRTLDAVSEAGHIEIDERIGPLSQNGIYAREWTFAPRQGRNDKCRWANAGETRVYAWGHGYGGNSNVGVEAFVAMPPGHVLRSAGVEDVVLTDAKGRNLGAPHEQLPALMRIAPRHVAGNVTHWELWRRGAPLTPEDLAGSGTVNLQGTLRLGYPHDYLRAEAAFEAGQDAVLRFPECVVKVELKPEEGDRFMAGLAVEGETRDRECWVWFEDASGQRLTDAPRLRGGSVGGHVRVKGKVARVVGILVTGEDHVKLPFEIRSIPLPSK